MGGESEEDAGSGQEGVVIGSEPTLPFYSQPYPAHQGVWEPSGLYARYNDNNDGDDDIHPLGSPDRLPPDPYASSNTQPRCFNCGDQTHVLSACPHRRDAALVALSRQIYDFEHARGGAARSLKEFAERLRKADWVAGPHAFVPGRVSFELRRALRWRADGEEEEEQVGGDDVLDDSDPRCECDDDGRDHPWLSNMALWGYPPGWVAVQDPREEMLARIMHENNQDDDSSDGEGVMKIWGENGEEEILLTPDPARSSMDAESVAPTSDKMVTMKRWAQYPDLHFVWDRLTVYNGLLLSEHGLRPPPLRGPPPEPTERPPPPPPDPPPPEPLPPAPPVSVTASFYQSQGYPSYGYYWPAGTYAVQTYAQSAQSESVALQDQGEEEMDLSD
ncbi:unnamed protein product [Mycena citricolor]|uniref:CCHC-type domain-containing protein n=1 Tax=Mycena citricolor TaxID=2018698 RepID=A0AAD2GZ06_9AGAR|nr:unnamed protein product [Mycena citricolor]